MDDVHTCSVCHVNVCIISTGSVTGPFYLTASFKKPVLRGYIHTDSVTIRMRQEYIVYLPM